MTKQEKEKIGSHGLREHGIDSMIIKKSRYNDRLMV